VTAMSFDNTFILLMVISVCLLPTLLLFGKPKAGAAAAAMH
jgi:hypothetical protein